MRNKLNLPAKSVVITFDDALKSVSCHAYPILKEYGFNATAFIISSRIKRHPQKWIRNHFTYERSELKGTRRV